MKELNELVEQAKEMSALHGPEWSSALCKEKDGSMHHAIISESQNDFFISTGSDKNPASWLCDYLELCSPANILAIAEAFRAREQRAKIAEADSASWKEEAIKAHEESEVVLAKLAELEKQEPIAWTSQANLDTLKSETPKTLEFMTGDISIYSNPVPLFTRPTPAVSLAKLVPDEKIEANFEMHRWAEKAMDIREVKGWNDCRAAILRNIEEKK